MANYPSQDFYCACAAGFFAVLSSGNDTPTHLKRANDWVMCYLANSQIWCMPRNRVISMSDIFLDFFKIIILSKKNGFIRMCNDC